MSINPRPNARPARSGPPQMAQRARRLPQARRLDYILIPAPLDLSLPSLTEKSPLPAIIVTPSSPTHSKDFAIAFLSQPPPPGALQRTKSRIASAFTTMRQAVPVPRGGLTSWTWRRRGYAPIALPISAPPGQTEFNVPTYPSNGSSDDDYYPFPQEKKRSNTLLFVLTTVFVLVFCHMLAHLFTRASGPSALNPFSASAVGMDLASTPPVLPAEGAKEGTKGALAYLGKLEVKQWFGWVARAGQSGSEGKV